MTKLSLSLSMYIYVIRSSDTWLVGCFAVLDGSMLVVRYALSKEWQLMVHNGLSAVNQRGP